MVGRLTGTEPLPPAGPDQLAAVRVSPMRTLCGSWVAYVVAALVTSPLAFADPITGILSATIGLVVYLRMRSRRTHQMGEASSGVGSPSIAFLVPPIAAAIGLWPAAWFVLKLEFYAYVPVPQVVMGSVFGILPFACILHARWGRAGDVERRRWWTATSVVLASQVAWISTVALQLIFMLHYPLLEAARLRAAGTGGWERDLRLGILTFDALGESQNFNQPTVYFAAEQCPWHDYDEQRGAGPDVQPAHMCFRYAGGVGFYHADVSAPQPALNQSAEGALFGGWHWYVDD